MPARDPLRVPAPLSGPTTPPKTVWPLLTKDSSTGWTGKTTWITSKDEKGLAKYMNTGSLLIKSQGHKWQNVKKHYDAVGVNTKN
jgi:hypothetical protein